MYLQWIETCSRTKAQKVTATTTAAAAAAATTKANNAIVEQASHVRGSAGSGSALNLCNRV